MTVHRPSPSVASAVRGAFALGLVVPAALAGQALGGRVVDAATGRPLAGTPVRLLRAAPRDSAPPADTTPLASAVTAADGGFRLSAPGPGSYRARIGDSFFTAVATLPTADSVDMRLYRLLLPTPNPDTGIPPLAVIESVARAGGASCKSQVEQQAATVLSARRTASPPMDRSDGVGKVTAQFVVDTTGYADMSTWTVLESTNDLFAGAAKDNLCRTKFHVAKVDGRKVRQVVQLPLTFTPRD